MSSYMQTTTDVPMHVRSDNSSSERRISPSWSIAQFKTRLEPITGIPSSSQRLLLRVTASQPDVPIEAANEEAVQLSSYSLQPYAEIHVIDIRPAPLRQSYTLTDPSAENVEKYTMPTEAYASRTDSVLAYKRDQQLGRFDPAAPSIQEAQTNHFAREIEERRIATGRRCRLLPPPDQQDISTISKSDERRGEVVYVGTIEELPGVGMWVGVRLDEPTGKNDGSIKGKRYFDCGGLKRGAFVRPERIEAGEFPVVDLLAEDMEEI